MSNADNRLPASPKSGKQEAMDLMNDVIASLHDYLESILIQTENAQQSKFRTSQIQPTSLITKETTTCRTH